MPYVFNTERDEQEMLAAIGAESIAELFEQVPDELQLHRPLAIPKAMGELELTRHMADLASRNLDTSRVACFLGGGSYDHFIPAAVDALAGRSEFYTSYTPYQPEVSQGNLQAMFEYQTLICALTGMEVSNASLYDGGSAVAEAVLMCMSVTRRSGNVLVPDTVHPEYRQILDTYLENLPSEIISIPNASGVTTAESVAARINDQTACVVLQYPSFFGTLEDVEAIAQCAHDAGAKLVLSFDPVSMGILRRPGDLGADVAVAEGHTLGSPMSYGGPYLGIMACREEFVRRMPGRIAGETTDRRGRRCWVLTLQTREQHIRREKATSNICSNQGLFALRASIYLALLGPDGLKQTATQCFQKAHYAAQRLTASERFEIAFDQPFGKEFVIRDRENDVAGALESAGQQDILAGIPLGNWYPERNDCFLVAVTETRTRQQIDRLAEALHNTHKPFPAST